LRENGRPIACARQMPANHQAATTSGLESLTIAHVAM
jgi:hypothetical protein